MNRVSTGLRALVLGLLALTTLHVSAEQEKNLEAGWPLRCG